MVTEVPPGSLTAQGERVWVRTVTAQDLPGYETAVGRSRARIGRWNPVSTSDLAWHLGRQSAEHRTFLIHAGDAEPGAGHDLVGKVNVSNVVRGRFQNGTMGYDSYDPYAGRGLFAEGLRLVVGLAFAPEGSGMGLHRVEANVRPGNSPSAGVLRSLGFRREGHVRSMLLLESGDEPARWRDHDTYAINRDEWPPAAYAEHRPPRIVALLDTPVARSLGPVLAGELGVPWLSATAVPDQAGRWAVLADSPVGAVVDVSDGIDPQDGWNALSNNGFDPRVVPWLRAGSAPRNAVDETGTVLRLGPQEGYSPAAVTRLALRVRASLA